MRVIETPWNQLGKFIEFGFGIPFFLCNGILWIFVGLILLLKAKIDKYKLEKLKKEGVCYECFVTEIVPINMIKIGSYLTARIKYTYNSKQSEINHISGYYLLSPWDRIENLGARIYIKKNNKRQKMLILFRIKDIFRV